jgi:uncharacterized protein DUF4062
MASPAAPIASSPREIRVFISSTFRDMQEEREELVKHIFPQLRRLCESRGVTWGEVDLRWGVPDEAKAEGKVLPLCLAEIAVGEQPLRSFTGVPQNPEMAEHAFPCVRDPRLCPNPGHRFPIGELLTLRRSRPISGDVHATD